MDLGFEDEGAEGLLVLGDVLAEDVPEGFGLLRAKEDGVAIADGDLLGRVASGDAEDELEVPHADPDLDAVGIGFAVIGGLGDLDVGLLRS